MSALVALLLIPILGGLLAWLAQRTGSSAPRYVALLTLGLDLAVLTAIAVRSADPGEAAPGGTWLAETSGSWIPRLGIQVHLALDGLSLVLVALTLLLGLAAIASAWREIDKRVGAFHLNLLWTLAGALGVFMALDLFLFFLFWELMLIPMFLVIAVWGHEQRQRAALKFMLYTQGSGLLLLLAIVSLALLHREHAGRLSFDYPELLAMPLDPGVSPWLMLGFFLAFAVKLPVVPLHTWLPDAHTQAPTAGSVLLAGILLKTGAYGLMRFVIPLFPDAAAAFAPVALGLGLTGIVYGAVLAFAQRDAKRLVAYSSISHLGFVLIGVFVWNTYALLGSVLQMLAHGISSAGLFILAGVLQQRLGSRDMAAMGGLQAQMPRLAAMGLCFALAALGLPGLGNFVAEFLVLLGTYQVSVLTSSVALAALVLAPIYALALMQRVFHGPTVQKHRPPADIGAPTLPTLGLLLLASLWLGLHPQPVLDVVQPAMTTLQSLPATTTVAGEANLGKLP